MSSFRFYRRKQIFPGVRLNISASGPSLSFGVRGARVTVGPRGVTRTVGIPGSGVYWTSRSGHSTGYHSGHVDGVVTRGSQSAAHAIGLALVIAFMFFAFGCLGLVALGAVAVASSRAP